MLIRPQRHHIRLYGVRTSRYSFTFPGCLQPGSSGSPGGSDSPGYLSPDQPHPGSATLLSPRIIDSIPRQSAQARILATDATCSGYKYFTLIDEKTYLPLSVRGAYKATTAPYQTIWCSYFSLSIHFLSPGVSGQVALAALVAVTALVIYHLTIHTRDPPHMQN